VYRRGDEGRNWDQIFHDEETLFKSVPLNQFLTPLQKGTEPFGGLTDDRIDTITECGVPLRHLRLPLWLVIVGCDSHICEVRGARTLHMIGQPT
jgi:hypothetical protein